MKSGSSTAVAKTASVGRLWWLEPAWPFALIIGCTMVAAFCQTDAAYWIYRTPKYIQSWHLALAGGAILAFFLGDRFAAATARRAPAAATAADDRVIRRWFYVLLGLTFFGYLAWFAVGVKNGFSLALARDLLMADDQDLAESVRRELFTTVPGITTCTQFGVPALLLGLWLYFRGRRGIVAPLVVLVLMASVRAVAFKERTALVEMFVPGVLMVMRMRLFSRPLPRWTRNGLRALPLLGPVVLLLFFGVFEYTRSWRYYRDYFDSYAQFTVWRLGGYYTTAHNNGAMALETHQPRPLPYYSIRLLWLFPGVRNSPLGYEKLTGLDVEESHFRMLERYGNIELNNEGGLFQPTLDFGIAGALLFWFGYGFVACRLYRAFLAGSFVGLTIFPLIYLSILEVPLVLFVSYSRMFPAFLSLAVVSWSIRRAALPADVLHAQLDAPKEFA